MVTTAMLFLAVSFWVGLLWFFPLCASDYALLFVTVKKGGNFYSFVFEGKKPTILLVPWLVHTVLCCRRAMDIPAEAAIHGTRMYYCSLFFDIYIGFYRFCRFCSSVLATFDNCVCLYLADSSFLPIAATTAATSGTPVLCPRSGRMFPYSSSVVLNSAVLFPIIPMLVFSLLTLCSCLTENSSLRLPPPFGPAASRQKRKRLLDQHRLDWKGNLSTQAMNPLGFPNLFSILM